MHSEITPLLGESLGKKLKATRTRRKYRPERMGTGDNLWTPLTLAGSFLLSVCLVGLVAVLLNFTGLNKLHSTKLLTSQLADSIAPAGPPSSDYQKNYVTTIFCVICPILGFSFSIFAWKKTSEIVLDPEELAKTEDQNEAFMAREDNVAKIWEVYSAIYDGAHSFLYAEYFYVLFFVIGFSIIILIVLGVTVGWVEGALTMVAFIWGCFTSILAGFIGMKIGVYANARTAVESNKSLAAGFITAFRAALVMGFCLTSLGILMGYILIQLFWTHFTDAMNGGNGPETTAMFEAIAGYGLGGSSIALFGRVGGGIYTKAADVGADLVGKVEQGIPEDDPRNPAVIADNVGDNVGDIAGMGADLFGSFAEATCAALVIGSQTYGPADPNSTFWRHWSAISFPLLISCAGILVGFITAFAAMLWPAKKNNQIEPTLKRQILISTVLMTPVLYGIADMVLPYNTPLIGGTKNVKNWGIFLCAASGLWAGLIIGYITEYYTSNAYQPVQELANACKTGAATNIIFGLALGYKSVIIPAIALALATYISHVLAGFYGIAIAALGILSTLSIGLTIDAFGPISDNAGGIAEMCEMGEETRDRTDALDAAGNTTAAIGKGFAIGSAAFVSLALFSGFVTIIRSRKAGILTTVNILSAFPFAGLLVGAMLPYWFSALTMKAVGKAALAMVEEVRRQFRENPEILDPESGVKPDYEGCIRISTNASLREMFKPGALVMLTPLIVGFFFGVEALSGVLVGALVSGVQMAISSSNTGGAWDNAKKYVERGELGVGHDKHTPTHDAAVIGDTVGDPLKDTSGPSLNILIKLMAIISLVFARSFPLNSGGFIGKIFEG